jgi:hypothetical protein
MKLEAKVKITNSPIPEIIANDTIIDVPVDMDYADDYDDIINDVEIWMYGEYGETFTNEVNFTIENAQDICDDLFNI